jgi:hypothetical protein
VGADGGDLGAGSVVGCLTLTEGDSCGVGFRGGKEGFEPVYVHSRMVWDDSMMELRHDFLNL